MIALLDLIDSMRAFMETGGDVLWVILLLAIVLWSLVVERFIYLRKVWPVQKAEWVSSWANRQDKHSWKARCIREQLISEAKQQLEKTVPIIKMLIGLCPLLGLLGTVTGMIHLFDVMAVTGTGNARAMASGVSQATIPTMAGMVIAIAGLYFSNRIEGRTKDAARHLSDLLKHD
ncbi:MAG: MotA/TolQ/ExbB proton channel family protein [Gammaproteobacteria bacterium]|nr:MAG: MotA/TolQ/ExbB proton channel family protein [Gammaproteobacteria bacterium]RLA24584.1 MAG: MotA/TolQ/ExbB proton channel family protein [Gammaproteobacteria bacterium]